LDDILSCNLPEYRNTKVMIEHSVSWKNEIFKTLILEGVEPFFTKPLIEKHPKLADYQLEETEVLRNFLMKTQDKLWSFNEETYMFVDPLSNHPLENGIFKIFILINMTHFISQSYTFLLKQFEFPFSDELLIHLAKHNQLEHNLISYVAYNENISKKAVVSQEEMKNRLHPQFPIMNEYQLKYQGQYISINEWGFNDLIKQYMTYSFDQVKQILVMYQDNSHEKTQKLSKLVNSLNLEDAHQSLGFLSTYLTINEDVYLRYIESAIKLKRLEALYHLIELYNSIDFDKKLMNIVFNITDDIEIIVYLIEYCTIFTDDKSVLEKYAIYKNISPNDIIIKLIEKNAKLEKQTFYLKRSVISLGNKI